MLNAATVVKNTSNGSSHLNSLEKKVSLHHMSRAQKSKKPYIVIILNDLES